MAKRRKDDRPEKKPSKQIKRLSKKELKAAYEKFRKEFTAADLQKYTVDEPMVPFADVIKEIERFVKREKRKRA